MTPAASHRLREKFEIVCGKLELPHEGYFEILDDLYQGRLRFYHNWDHIEHVLDRLEDFRYLAEENDTRLFPLVQFAAFYHDAIYVPGFAENERLSADLAMSHMEVYDPWSLAPMVARWIFATKDHKPGWSLGGRMLCDADLFGLATDDYGINGLNVRREFGAFFDHDWRIGRTKFLSEYGSRDPLFYLEGQEELEAQAKAHMEAELRTLMGDAATAGSDS